MFPSSSSSSSSKKDDGVEAARQARLQRAQQKKDLEDMLIKDKRALIVQTCVRRYLARRRFCLELMREFDCELGITTASRSCSSTVNTNSNDDVIKADLKNQKEASQAVPSMPCDLFRLTQSLMFFARDCSANLPYRLFRLCIAILASIPDSKNSYFSCATKHGIANRWIRQVKHFCVLCLNTCASLSMTVRDAHFGESMLKTVLYCCDSQTWQLLGPETATDAKETAMRRLGLSTFAGLIFKHIERTSLFSKLEVILEKSIYVPQQLVTDTFITIAATLALKPLFMTPTHQNMQLFAIHILSVGSFVLRVKACSPFLLEKMGKENVLPRVIHYLKEDQSAKILFNSLEANKTLFLLANLVQLMDLEAGIPIGEYILDLMSLTTKLSMHCAEYVARKETNVTMSHPIFGWFSGHTPACMLDILPLVREQLSLYWSPRMVKSTLCDPLWEQTDLLSQSKKKIKMEGLASHRILKGAMLYESLLRTFAAMKSDIMSSLAFYPSLVPRLWTYLAALSTGSQPFDAFLSLSNELEKDPNTIVLLLACEISTRYLIVVDDEELFEKKASMSMPLLLDMTRFLNVFLFRGIWNSKVVEKKHFLVPPEFSVLGGDDFSEVMHGAGARLLALVVDRDVRHPFTPPDFWLVREVSSSTLESFVKKEVDEKTVSYPDGSPSRSQRILDVLPHVIPYKSRVALFRQMVKRDSSSLAGSEGMPKVYVTIRRSAILADGFRELSRLNANQVKGIIKIKFINELGMEEIGIDEKGVFKEFLEQTIKAAFDPQFGLFRTTANQQLYPSPLSDVHAEHFQLFEFVGRMLGKACYEGIVVEVPFALFFLNAMLGRTNTLDELPSLEPELAKNLSYVKQYDGDVSDLELTFSVDEERFGEIVSTPLIPGGGVAVVNNSNRILYTHLMADFRLNKQLRRQTKAFTTGFLSVVHPSWISFFSALELQRLISGDAARLDIDDMRSHANYIGGYHRSHKVIKWLWEIVGELSMEEQALFLKFVTSCSKPPILGFAAMEPPLTIRCVSEGQAEEQYTLGSVLRNFFTSGDDTDRLPTASTCFNLLKLPPYKSKKTLREKLKYAINAGAGFELS